MRTHGVDGPVGDRRAEETVEPASDRYLTLKITAPLRPQDEPTAPKINDT